MEEEWTNGIHVQLKDGRDRWIPEGILLNYEDKRVFVIKAPADMWVFAVDIVEYIHEIREPTEGPSESEGAE